MDKLLEELKTRQLRPKALVCTASSNCWCHKLETKLPHHEGYDVCLAPTQLLQLYEKQFTCKDINYLKSLEHKELAW
jgi:hypothetical protein